MVTQRVKSWGATVQFVPPIVAVSLWAVAAASAAMTHSALSVYFFAYLGVSLGIGLGLYFALPRTRQSLGRRLLLLLIGAQLIGMAAARGFADVAVFQLEGVFFELLTGAGYAAVVHYLLGKIAGPLLFGRVWCGWACWTAMLLDLLPYKTSPGRLSGRWGLLRYLHFGVSLALVAALVYGLAYAPTDGPTALLWFLGGNALYFVLGVALAIVLKDNRAFCKYLCPVAVPLKLGAPFALIKVKGDAATCNGRGECERVCPMDIRVSEYVRRGERVTSSECILCQACIGICPSGALKLSLGADPRRIELLHERAPEPGA